MWKVAVKKAVQKNIRKLPKPVRAILDEAIEDLKQQGPHPKNWDIVQLDKDEYRIRLNYRYRMIYMVIKQLVLIEIIYAGHRKDAYTGR